jgi:hypothetical protein
VHLTDTDDVGNVLLAHSLRPISRNSLSLSRPANSDGTCIAQHRRHFTGQPSTDTPSTKPNAVCRTGPGVGTRQRQTRRHEGTVVRPAGAAPRLPRAAESGARRTAPVSYFVPMTTARPPPHHRPDRCTVMFAVVAAQDLPGGPTRCSDRPRGHTPGGSRCPRWCPQASCADPPVLPGVGELPMPERKGRPGSSQTSFVPTIECDRRSKL